MNTRTVDILLVEDDAVDLQLARRELEQYTQIHIEAARDGEEALDFLFCRGAFASRSPDHRPSWCCWT